MENIIDNIKKIVSGGQKPSLPVGVVLSGGGSRAAFQVGALKALAERGILTNSNIEVITGSSIGAINGLILAAGLNHSLGAAIAVLEELWCKRTFKNTFEGHPSKTFLRAIQIAFLRYSSPEPDYSPISIFNPILLQTEVDAFVAKLGGLHIGSRKDNLRALGVMTTREDSKTRSPLLVVSAKQPLSSDALIGATFKIHYVDEIHAAHGFASAALPSVLPPVKINVDEKEVELVDGGISDNVPVDPAVRFGAEDMYVLDCSGRRWWFDHYGEPHYKRPSWEVPAAPETYCCMPQRYFDCVNEKPFGPILKEVVGRSSKDFMRALGPTWPIFKILSMKMGSALAYEVMSYAALHPEYSAALIRKGYTRALAVLKERDELEKRVCAG